jgi:hypothetical protein
VTGGHADEASGAGAGDRADGGRYLLDVDAGARYVGMSLPFWLIWLIDRTLSVTT